MAVILTEAGPYEHRFCHRCEGELPVLLLPTSRADF